MSAYDRKFAAAMAELSQTAMWKGSYAPPMLAALRRLGGRARPPHYVRPIGLFLVHGGAFGPFWGIVMWFFYWRAEGIAPVAAIGAAALAGARFGAAMVLVFGWGRRKWRLSRWQDL